MPTEADQAIDFIKWLDKTRYGQLQTDLDNNAALGEGTYPTDLQKAYTIVSQYKMNEVMLGAAAPSRPNNIFVATSNGEGENDAKGNKKERKKAGNHAKRDDSTQEDIGEEDRSSEQDRRSRRNKHCKIGKSTKHWTGACQLIKRERRRRRQMSGNK